MDKKINLIWFDQLNNQDVKTVGGKNASLGEMIRAISSKGVRVPNGFATTAHAYRDFLKQNDLQLQINRLLHDLVRDDVGKLEIVGKKIRNLILNTPFLPDFEADVLSAYRKLVNSYGASKAISVAVRSSATAEDLPEASFAGQQETYLNVRDESSLIKAIKLVFASLYTDRAIVYRINNKFEHSKVALSAGIQKMVKSDEAGSGVAFSIDTESGFQDAILINAAFGLGETIVQGSVNPDEYFVYKPSLKTNHYAILRKIRGEKEIKMVYENGNGLDFKTTKIVSTSDHERSKMVLTDDEIHELARYVAIIEDHYKRPMDIEWAKDAQDNKIYIVQARPETVKSRDKTHTFKKYILKEKGEFIAKGRSVGQKIGQGKARVLDDVSEILHVRDGDVLVTNMTDPDWEPVMKRTSAIVTNQGGRTCHAAIVARELGIPAVVGCGNATTTVEEGKDVTVSCAEGEIGYVYSGLLHFESLEQNVDKMPKLPVKIMLNIADPNQAFDLSFLPNDGVGLARMEFIINDMIGIHPNALINFDTLPINLKDEISKKTVGYDDPVKFYVDKLREGISMIAAAFSPKPVIFRTSDFKSNEYANLLGGALFEPEESNPMIGFRGASRYTHERFSKCFVLECKALKAVRDDMGLTNVEVMIPFVRTVDELKGVLEILAHNGLKRGENGLRIIMMCEIPSNIILAEEFLEHVDGYSVGSNDLTQLTLGLDRDSDILAPLFDERNQAVKDSLQKAIKICRKMNKYIGICGQAPSDFPDLAKWLLQQKIDSISLNPDSVIKTWLHLAKK